MVSADDVLAALLDLDVQSVDVKSQTHTAQKQASAAAPGVVGFRRAGGKPSLAAAGLMGRWVDSFGNRVSVYSTDVYEMRPMAILMKGSQPPVHLRLVPANGGWRCGEAVVDIQQSSTSQVCWVFPDGTESCWTRWQDGCECPEASVRTNPQPYFMLMPIGFVQTAF